MADPPPDHSWLNHSPRLDHSWSGSGKYNDLVLSDLVIDGAPSPGVVLGLHRATHATLQVLSARLAGLDLPASEINVLASLAGHHLLTVGALANATATRPTTLTSVLDRLARRGYVVREVDPADRRSFLISLTPAGQRAAATVSAAVSELEQAALAGVSPAQRAGFFAVVDALSEVSA